MAIKVLITGMGQVLGIGILKALKMSSLECICYGCDCEPRSAGLYMSDQAYILNNAVYKRNDYLKQLANICQREKISVIFPGSEPEIKILAPVARDFQRETGTFVIVSSPSVIQRFMDKWLTYRFMKTHDFPVPETILPKDKNINGFLSRHDFPLLIKPRQGSSSSGVEIINNQKQLHYFTENHPGILLQEYIRHDNQEYTVGVFLDKSGHSNGTMILRRQLSSGITFRAEVVRDEEISTLCRKVGEKSGVMGPCNIQLIMSGQGLKLLEINPRFSSSVAIRAHFGYNEPAMCIEHFIFNKKPTIPEVHFGMAMRYWDEIYVNQAGDKNDSKN